MHCRALRLAALGVIVKITFRTLLVALAACLLVSLAPAQSAVPQSYTLTVSSADRKSTRLNSTLSLHDALPIYRENHFSYASCGSCRLPSRFTCSRPVRGAPVLHPDGLFGRSEEHTSELHSFPTRRSSDLS